jgi:hypothetical protein
MAIYFRSPEVVITDRLIKVRIPQGWRVWVIGDLSGFGIVSRESPSVRLNWGLGWSALVVLVLASQLRGWLVVLVTFLLLLAGASFVVGRRRASQRARSQLWARRDGRLVLVFELRARDFHAACRALRRVLDRRDDVRHGL